MRAGRVSVIATAVAACALALGSCGGGASASAPLSLSSLPLVQGASVVTQSSLCDRGANAFCAVTAVIVDRHASSSGALVRREFDYLHALGWTGAAGDEGAERAANSPGHKLHVTYSTAQGDLTGIDLGWIKRAWPITWSLSRTMFQRVPAMSIMFETGPA
jgi:hypothetical protein